MRVIAGQFKGRRLSAPEGSETRPTSDGVREAIFNVLTSEVGSLDGVTALDLFAGSGALGIEALSRGAAHVTFVERSRRAQRAIRTNLSAVGVDESRVAVVAGDVMRSEAARGSVDVAFADPPYAFDDWVPLFARLNAELVVAESDRAVDPGAEWEVLRVKQYGTTVVTLVSATKGAL